ncbi:biopolymer transporter ExbD [bacterium]|nr:biopolymer transporter ExbD [bacterium]
MRFGRRAPGEGPLAEINTTPLIDVSLVLVVILLLATPLTFESSFGVRKGDALAQPALVADRQDRVELTITGERQVEVNGRAVAVDQLAGALRPLLRPGSPREIAVACGDQVSHGAFVRVLDIARQNGAQTISVAGD